MGDEKWDEGERLGHFGVRVVKEKESFVIIRVLKGLKGILGFSH